MAAPELTKIARPASDCRSRGSRLRIKRQLAVRLTSTVSAQTSGSTWPSGDRPPSTPAKTYAATLATPEEATEVFVKLASAEFMQNGAVISR